MNTYFISFRKQHPRRTIRVEFAISNCSRREARLIAEKEIAALRGYRFLGSN